MLEQLGESHHKVPDSTSAEHHYGNGRSLTTKILLSYCRGHNIHHMDKKKALGSPVTSPALPLLGL